MTSIKKPARRRSTKKVKSKDLINTDSGGIALRTTESIMDSKHLFFSQEDFQSWHEEMWSTTDLKQRSQMQLSRTSLLLQDYRQFKAARTIQKQLRRWYCRCLYLRKLNAVIRIQYEWRKFYKARCAYRMLEERAQQAIMTYYNQQATKIQALWRGWHARQNIHDHSQLLKSQVLTAEELLQCIAFKLHHMLRTYQIPGVFSMKNSHCLSKVERLLAAMSFKQHNKHARQLRNQIEGRIKSARKRFVDSTFTTEVPYAGSNLKGLCDAKCAELEKSKNFDRRMFQILNAYEEATKAENLQKRNLPHRKHESNILQMRNRVHDPPSKSQAIAQHATKHDAAKKTDFCQDIVNSMKRWRILKENNVSVDPNIFRRPDLLERFLQEIDSIYNLMQNRCHCLVNANVVEG